MTACLDFDPNSVFVFTAATTKDQVPRNVRFVLVDGSVRVLPDDIFRDCESLEEVTFEECTHTIGKSAFLACVSLSKVKLPSTLREILESAFECCYNLTSIDLPVGLKVIEESVFEESGLRHLKVPATVEIIEYRAFHYCKHLVSIVLPPSLEVIESDLFSLCFRLEDIEIPRTIKAIGDQAFEDCSSLKELDLEHCIECLTIGHRAFYSCSKPEWINLPPNLEGSIEGGTFAKCSALTHIRVSQNITSIGRRGESNPFRRCKSLLSLELPEGLETIELLAWDDASEVWKYAFEWASLVNVYLPPSQTLLDVRILSNEPIPEDWQLAKVAQTWGDLVPMLQRRFDGLPLHRVCYFHSYHPVEDTAEKIRNILKLTPSAVNEVDAFGMTPLHILSLAQKPVVELLQELPIVFAEVALSSKDFFGSTPLDYVCKNPLPEGMNASRWMIRKILEGKLPFLGLRRWKQELLVAEERRLTTADTSSMRAGVKSLLGKLAHLEFLEILSLVEMVLWQIKLNENVMVETGDDKPRSDRESCRVQCGISIVIGNILPFLREREVIAQAEYL
ncbi:unnamed protein product [Cylindrotheca closterium]|uniref:Uncharacterized protein n=1 Tax=Cylindrotheca closterium TaxID=2856 RepID=A0AAD2G6F4_9STRA|nr:unnamed protein product [Cylindrotheca closterium]